MRAGDNVDAAGGGEGATGVQVPWLPGHGQGMAVPVKASDVVADCYSSNHKRRGQAIIINNKTFFKSTKMNVRKGTDVDAEKLYTMLVEMGFVTVRHDDCTIKQMELILSNEALKESHRDADCFVCAILSHGEKDVVYGTDGPIEISKLVEPFKGCQYLAGKPKIFFIQACRGDKLDCGTDVTDSKGGMPEDMEIDPVEVRKIPTEADFLMVYSTVPGYYSWRNTDRGSWFVQALVDVLRDNWKHMDMLTMMTRVSKKVAYDFESNVITDEKFHKKKQVPCITSMLTRDLYFPPK